MYYNIIYIYMYYTYNMYFPEASRCGLAFFVQRIFTVRACSRQGCTHPQFSESLALRK